MSKRVQPHSVEFRLRAQLECWNDSIGLYIIARDGVDPSKRYGLAPLSFQPLEPYIETPRSLALRSRHAQQLMDDLYAAGIRPTEGKGSIGAVTAQEKHLQDLRGILFHQLKINPNKSV